MTGRIAVAISTTGDAHRIESLQRCVENWDAALPADASLFVTVDGSELDTRRAASAVNEWTESVYRVGAPEARPDAPRVGVAANKNTGLELLMDNTRAEHLFLCDDDTWPLFSASLSKHTNSGLKHSMVCWGWHRLVTPDAGGFSTWTWPRGVLLYAHREAVEKVGGMDERFGLGGHEHAEWSTRMFNAGLTPAPFCAPVSYAQVGVSGQATRASALWHCSDMPMPGETLGDFRRRKAKFTTVRTTDADWRRIDKVMAERENSSAYVYFRARDNARASATLCTSPSRGAGGEK